MARHRYTGWLDELVTNDRRSVDVFGDRQVRGALHQ
jgi:hypothetical protein